MDNYSLILNFFTLPPTNNSTTNCSEFLTGDLESQVCWPHGGEFSIVEWADFLNKH